MENRTPNQRLTMSTAFLLGLLMASLLIFTACAATGGTVGLAKEALCAVHNSNEMIVLCENPIRK